MIQNRTSMLQTCGAALKCRAGCLNVEPKGQEKSKNGCRNPKRRLTKTFFHGIFITLISTQTE